MYKPTGPDSRADKSALAGRPVMPAPGKGPAVSRTVDPRNHPQQTARSPRLSPERRSPVLHAPARPQTAMAAAVTSPAGIVPADEAVSPHAFLPGLAHLDRIGLDTMLSWLLSRRKLVALTTALCLAGGLAFALLTPPRYKVFTDIVIDPANLNVVNNDVFASSPQRDAQLLEVESRLRILTSRNVLWSVVDKLELAKDREFVKPDLLGKVTSLFMEPKPGDDRLVALRALTERVEATREERSFVVVLSTWSDDPDKSVKIANAIVDAFEEELFKSESESAGRVAKDIGARLDSLRKDVTDAEQKVEELRREQGIQSSRGELVSNQISGELNSQVLQAQQRMIDAESRYRQMDAAYQRKQTESALVFDSETMTTLRERYNTVLQEIGSLRMTYGDRHPRLTSAQSEQQALQTAMRIEARRILDTAKGAFDRQKQAYQALKAKAGDEKSNVFKDYDTQVRLRDLERDARAKAALYETYLGRARQIAERQQIDATNVRVISAAVPPKAKSWPPRTMLVLAAAGMAGLALGFGLSLASGLWRFLRNPRFG